MSRTITATPTAALGADSDALVAAADGLVLMGFTARDSNNAAAHAKIKNAAAGNAAAGTVVAVIGLPANGFARAWFGPEGIPCPDGVSIDWISGAPDVVVYTRNARSNS
jgi:hypothetical protein